MAEEGVLDKVEKCGYLVNGHMADVSMRAKLRGLKNANGDPLFKSDMQGSTQYALDGSPMNFPINGAWDKSKALMVSGDFSQLVFSIRQDITFKLFTEGVVQNTDGTIAYSRQYVDEASERSDVVGYAPSMDYEFDLYTNDAVQKKLATITDDELLGSDAQVTVVVVDLFETKADDGNTCTARKRDWSVIPDTEGDGTDALIYKGSLKAAGEIIKGTATTTDSWQTCTFTAE